MNEVESLKRRIIKILERASSCVSLDRPGDVIQCPAGALRQGKFYVMGFNPGGGANGRSLRNTTGQLGVDSGAHPLSEGWPRGWSNLKRLAAALKVDDWERRLFITNLFPNSSSGVSAWLRNRGGRQRRHEFVRQIWPLHQLFMSIVRPQYVIVHGIGSSDSAFRYLWEHLVRGSNPNAEWNDTMARETKADPTIKSFLLSDIALGNGDRLKNVRFIGIRHLSYPQSGLDVMKNLIPDK